MQIETERLVVRTLQAADAPLLAALWMDPDVTRYMGGPRDYAQVLASIQDDVRRDPPPSFDLWPVFEKASGRLVGNCGLIDKVIEGRSEIELVYVFALGAWGRGYATEAAAAIRDHAFGVLALPRLVALIDPANAASGRVAEKIGMRLERDTQRPGGKWMRLYAIHAS
jgi:RimJ/RimL family protein N-acetyltransferase